jgi:hypothetical protein
MAPFRRVEDCRAGASALGILVPPGRRTVVILRPRAVPWDLLALRPADGHGALTAFCDFERDEAAGVARRVQQALAHAAGAGGCPVEMLSSPGSAGYRVCLRAAGFTWLACPRAPGQPYRPVDFSTPDEARDAAARLARFLCPAADADQEYYFNTQNFSRS